ncbi:MAG: gamma-glutamyl-gamma-aminobutyrate hydrolase family protein, partial [Deltaproteobacteria bacterium]|nr:gamma-glutamyl-gamma-aminobutyrate hydrolase family protein [Deltaproteobacteria bacterium]
MKILVMIHVESEGPGTLGTFLESVGAQLVTTRLYASEPLPANAGEFDAVLSMGGPMNVYQEDAYPFLKQETAFLQDAVSADVPVLGVCLGAQMIAKACGARV